MLLGIIAHQRPAAGSAVSPWLPLAVSLVALAFTILTFWWTNLRKGKLQVGYPRTFAATTQRSRVMVLLPLSLRNTGPISIGVRALRLQLSQDSHHCTLHHVRTRTAMRLEESSVDFATNFVVDGRQTLLRLAEFEAADAFTFSAGRVEASLEVLLEDSKRWRGLRTFALFVTSEAESTIPKAFITYDNAPLLPH